MVPVPESLERGLEIRVLALLGSLLGAEPTLLGQDGFVVADHRDFAGERRAIIGTARGTLLLAAPAERAGAAADPATYASDVADRARGTGLLHYFAGSPVSDPIRGCAHSELPIARFRSNCSSEGAFLLLGLPKLAVRWSACRGRSVHL